MTALVHAPVFADDVYSHLLCVLLCAPGWMEGRVMRRLSGARRGAAQVASGEGLPRKWTQSLPWRMVQPQLLLPLLPASEANLVRRGPRILDVQSMPISTVLCSPWSSVVCLPRWLCCRLAC